MTDESKPMVTRAGLLSMQVCVPKTFTDEEARDFAEQANPCGTSGGWHMRKTGNELLADSPERVQCEEREDCVHIMFDA